MEDLAHILFNKLVSVDRFGVDEILNQKLKEGGIEGLGEVLMKAMEEIGAGWESGKVSLAQVYMSGVICEELLSSILPETDMIDNELPIVGAAVLLDHHGLGMKIVSNLVRSHRYPLINLGIGVDADKIIKGISEKNIQILMISVLMYPSALAIMKLSERMAIECPEVPIVVGGAPFRLDSELHKKVGAHRSAGNASEIFGILDDLGRHIVSREELL